MDDILASIRKILNEDDVPPPEGEPRPEAEALPPEQPAPAPVMAAPVAPPPAAPFAPPPSAAAPPPPPPPIPATPSPLEEDTEDALELTPDMMIGATRDMSPAPPPPLPGDMLIGATTAAATAAALSHLTRAVSGDRGAAIYRSGGASIEDVVREELRPLLKAWLDQHLPPLVERIVRAEIERVSARIG